ncbi:hypothetical protein, partial [Streptococcus pseudopneumoniae]|uniref:hypothetical protein n=1 Tax=Streptococcus pseudopneumoniae TaxID=257758 RepID=UPI0014861FD6
LTNLVASNLPLLAGTKLYSLEIDQGLAANTEALRLSKVTGNYRAELVATATAAYLLIEKGSFKEALASAETAAALSRQYGLDVVVAVAERHQASAYLEMGKCGKASELAELAWDLCIEHGFELYIGGWCLGLIVRSSSDNSRRNWAISEGFQLCSKGTVSHNHYYFYRD